MSVSADERIRVVVEWINKNSEIADKVKKDFKAITDEYKKAKVALEAYAKTPQGRRDAFNVNKQIKDLDAAYKKKSDKYKEDKEEFKILDTINSKIKEQGVIYDQVKGILIDYNKPLKDQKKTYEALKTTQADAVERIGNLSPVLRQTQTAMRTQQRQALESKKTWDNYSSTILHAGRAIGFYGFIASFSIQRLLVQLQNVAGFFTNAIQKTANWTDTLVETAVNMAYLRHEGLLTADMEKTLTASMINLKNNGQKVQALWGGLQSAWASVQVTLATTLIPTLTQLVNVAGSMLQDPAIQNSLVRLAQGFGALAIAVTPLLPTIADLASAVAGFMAWLQPWYGIIIPLTAGIFVLGTALTIIGPLVTGIGYVIKILTMIKQAWGYTNLIVTTTLTKMKFALINVGTAAVAVASILFMFMRMSTAQAKNVTDDLNRVNAALTGSSIDIVDSNGDVIYSVDTLTGEVKNAAGDVIGTWNSVDDSIRDASDNIIGYLDPYQRIFSAINNGMEEGKVKITNSLQDIQTAINGFDLSGLSGGFDDVTDSINQMTIIMGAVSFATLGAQIAGIILKLTGAGGLSLSLGTVTSSAVSSEAALLTLGSTSVLASISSLAVVLSGAATIAAAFVVGLDAIHRAYPEAEERLKQITTIASHGGTAPENIPSYIPGSPNNQPFNPLGPSITEGPTYPEVPEGFVGPVLPIGAGTTPTEPNNLVYPEEFVGPRLPGSTTVSPTFAAWTAEQLSNYVLGKYSGYSGPNAMIDDMVNWAKNTSGAGKSTVLTALATIGSSKGWTSNQISLVQSMVPNFARGAIVNRPTVGVFGEKGPEGIFKLKDMTLSPITAPQTTPQFITNHVTIYIAQLSSEVDINHLVDEIDERLADKARRRQ